MSKTVINTVVAKQLMTTLKMIENQLKLVADSKQVIPHMVYHTVIIDEEKITPIALQRINQTLIEIYVELSDGIEIKEKERTLPEAPRVSGFESGPVPSLNPFLDRRRQKQSQNYWPQPMPSYQLNGEDTRLLIRAQQFEQNMWENQQNFGDFYCEIFEKEPGSFQQNQLYGLHHRGESLICGLIAQTREINTDQNFFNIFKTLPITTLHIE